MSGNSRVFYNQKFNETETRDESAVKCQRTFVARARERAWVGRFMNRSEFYGHWKLEPVLASVKLAPRFLKTEHFPCDDSDSAFS